MPGSIEADFCRGLDVMVVEGTCPMCGDGLAGVPVMKLSCGCFGCSICVSGVLASASGRCKSTVKRCRRIVEHYAAIKPGSANARGTGTAGTRNEVTFVQVEPRIGGSSPVVHPFHYCVEENITELKKGGRKIVLAGGIVEYDADAGGCRLAVANSIVLGEYQGPEDNLTKEQTETICSIVALARIHIRETSINMWPQGTDNEVAVLSVKEYFEDSISKIVDGCDPMARVLMSLSSPGANFGFVDKTQLRKNANFQRKFISFAVARDVLLPGVRHLQAMMCDQLSLEPSTSTEFTNLLSALNISASQSVLNRKSAQAAVDRLIEGKKLEKGDVGIFGFDNVTQHGKPDMDHYIVCYGERAPKKLLDRLSFDAYSRITQIWDEIVSNNPERARALTALTERDHELLSGTILGYFLLALK